MRSEIEALFDHPPSAYTQEHFCTWVKPAVWISGGRSWTP